MSIIDLSNSQEPDFFSEQVRTARRFFRPEETSSGSPGYHIISGGMENCIPGYEVNRSDFSYWAVELVSSGRGSLALNGREFNLIPGSVYAYGPGIRHRIAADRDEALEKYFIDMTRPGAMQPSFSIIEDQLSKGVLYSHSLESLRRTFEELIEYGRIHTSGSGRICSKLVEILLLKITDTSSKHSLSESPAYTTYRRCREIIDNRFSELVSIGKVADEANVDISYLCRLFKKFDTQSPYKRLTRLRMNHAAGILIRDGLSVKQIAMELGYMDPFTFSKRFKTTMGLSPQQFVKKYRTGHFDDGEG